MRTCRYQSKEVSTRVDMLRDYYGPLLGSPFEFVRELAAKTFSLVLRKVPAKSLKQHLKKVIRAITANMTLSSCDNLRVLPVELDAYRKKRLDHLIEGVAILVFYNVKGVKSCLHSRSVDILKSLFSLNEPAAVSSPDVDAEVVRTLHVYVSGRVVSRALRSIVPHIHPKNSLQIWSQVIESSRKIPSFLSRDSISDTNRNENTNATVDIFSLHMIEFLIFLAADSSSRLLSDKVVKEKVSPDLIEVVFNVCSNLFSGDQYKCSSRAQGRARVLFCTICRLYFNDKHFLAKVSGMFGKVIGNSESIADAVTSVVQLVFPHVSEAFLYQHAMKPTLCALLQLSSVSKHTDPAVWLSLLVDMTAAIADVRPRFERTRVVTQQDEREAPSDDGLIATETLSCIDCKKSFCFTEIERKIFIQKGFGRPTRCKGCRDSKKFRSSHTSEKNYRSIDGTFVQNVFSTCGDELISLAACAFDIITDSQNCSEEELHGGLLANFFIRWLGFALPAIFDSKKLKPKFEKFTSDVQDFHFLETLALHNANKLLPSHLFFLLEEKTMAILVFEGKDPSLASFGAQYVETLLYRFIDQPLSLSLLWQIEKLLHVCNSFSLTKFLVDVNVETKFIQALCVCVVSPSYWMKYLALRLATLLRPPEVCINPTTGEMVQIDIIGMLLEALTVPIALKTEREYVRVMEKIEVLVRTGRIPQKFIDVTRACCLGFLRVKFQPFWEPAMKVILADSDNASSNDSFWSLLLLSIENLFRAPLQAREVGESSGPPAALTCTLHACVELRQRDDGEACISESTANSKVFFMDITSADDSSDDRAVYSDSRADNDTAFKNLWAILKRCPAITLKRSKVIIPIFLRFLNEQYYATLSGEAEVSDLQRLGFLSEKPAGVNLPALPIPVLKKRLEMFLQVFATVVSPKQLYKHATLYYFYFILMSRPDTGIAKLAFDCILTYKSPSVVPYKENINRILSDSTMREELLVFSVAPGEACAIDATARHETLPLVVYAVYGRFMARTKTGGKKGRIQASVRKNAVLQFLSALPAKEIGWFLHLLMRGLLCKEKIQSALALYFEKTGTGKGSTFVADTSIWFDLVEHEIMSLEAKDMVSIVWEKQVAYLRLLEHMIKIFGLSLTLYIPLLSKLVLVIIHRAQSWRDSNATTLETFHVKEDGDEDEDEELESVAELDGLEKRIMNQTGKIRTYSLLRLSGT